MVTPSIEPIAPPSPRRGSVTVRAACRSDLAAISSLHETVFGPGRFARTAYRVREGTPPISPFCQVVVDQGEVVGAIRFTQVRIGGKPNAVLLGPIAVLPGPDRRGLGGQLISHGLDAVAKGGLRIILLVGDLEYYGRHGFSRVPPDQVQFPGPVDPARILYRETKKGALADYAGAISPAV